MDYEKFLWGKKYTIDTTIVGEIHCEVTQVIGLWKQDEILFSFFDRDFFRKYWSYSTMTGRMRRVNIKDCENLSSSQDVRVYSLRGSLISISGATEVS